MADNAAPSVLDLDAEVKKAGGGSMSYVGDALKQVRGYEAARDKETAPILADIQKTYAKDKADVESKQPTPADFKPWTAKPPEQDPIQAFGSFGSVFGILASAFTHQPWQSSMNAAAASINALKAGDAAAYKEAYQAWKDNTELALKRHEEQSKDFSAAMEKMKTDVAEGNAMLTATSAKYGDHIQESYREAGLLGDMVKIHDSREAAAVGMAEAKQRLEEQQPLVDLKMAYTAALKTKDPVAIAKAANDLKEYVTATTPSYLAAEARAANKAPTLASERGKAIEEAVASGMSRQEAIRQVDSKSYLSAASQQKIGQNITSVKDGLDAIDDAKTAMSKVFAPTGVLAKYATLPLEKILTTLDVADPNRQMLQGYLARIKNVALREIGQVGGVQLKQQYEDAAKIIDFNAPPRTVLAQLDKLSGIFQHHLSIAEQTMKTGRLDPKLFTLDDQSGATSRAETSAAGKPNDPLNLR